VKIPEHMKSELQHDFNNWLQTTDIDSKSLKFLAVKPFYESAWMAHKQDAYIWSFYDKNKLGLPNWDGDKNNICVICDLEGCPILTLESYLPLSKSIWSELANYVVDNIGDDTGKYTDNNYFVNVFNNLFSNAPFIVHLSAYYIGLLNYDGN